MIQPAAICEPVLATRPSRCTAITLLLAILSVGIAPATAQPPAPPTTAQPPASPPDGAQSSDADSNQTESQNIGSRIEAMSGRIQYVGPDTYILLDSEGRPQPVPGMTYEDFLAAWKKTQQQDELNRNPRFAIEQINIDGKTLEGRAELTFVATVRLRTDEPVDVPLGLVGTILQGEPKFDAMPDSGKKTNASRGQAETPVNEYLTYEPDHGGFVAQLSGNSGDRRIVTLNLIVPLLRDGAETTLPLNCPRAISSNLNLDVEGAVTEANVNSGTLLARGQTSGNKSRIRVAGPVGAFRLAWRSGENGSNELATVLSAAGAVRVSIDGRSVRTNARLTVQSYGGSFDRFRVRLPRGALLLRDQSTEGEGQNAAYRLTLDDASKEPRNGAAARDDARQIVLIELPEKQQGPITVELATEQPIGLEGRSSSVDLAGFEVLGAVRQFGDIALEVADDWQARWEIGSNVRQVEPVELDSTLQQAGVVAAFQYDGQPWSLGVQIAARKTRVHVTPSYELDCTADEARLTAHLTYQVFGSRAFEFRVRTQGWDLTGDPLQSGGIIDQERIHLEGDDILVLPLAQGSSRRAEITFTVRRSLPRDGSRIELPLPVPVADSVGTGELVVRAAADVELRPDLEKSLSLAPIPTTEAARADGSGDGAQLRFRAALPDPTFVAERINRPRDIATELVTRVEFAQTEAQVDERVDYVVRYAPIKDLYFEAPSELTLDENDIRVTLLSSSAESADEFDESDTPLSFTSAVAEEQSTRGGLRKLRVALPQPRLGAFSLRIRYRLPRPIDSATPKQWNVLLLRPTDGRTTAAHAFARSPRSLSAVLAPQSAGVSWAAASNVSETTETDSLIEFVSEKAELTLPLELSALNFNMPTSTTVERVWLQVWLSGDVRQDRAAFRFRTTGSQVTVELPPETPSDQIEILVDGHPADVLSRAVGRITVRVPKGSNDNGAGITSSGAVHTLELRFRQSNPRTLVARHRLTPPQLVGTATLSQVYWHIVLPLDQHVIRSPSRMSSASQWQWLNSFWGHRPILSQPQLEEWVGATSQPAPAAQNEYLYTGLAPVRSIELIAAPRWLIVLAASSVALALIAAWLYLPTHRGQRAWLLVAIAGVIAVLAISFPLPAMLLAQASVLGVVIAIISVMITRLMARPTSWPVTLSAGSSQRQITPRAESIIMPPVVAAASTAPTASLRAPDSE